jgi:hypothetical protein
MTESIPDSRVRPDWQSRFMAATCWSSFGFAVALLFDESDGSPWWARIAILFLAALAGTLGLLRLERSTVKRALAQMPEATKGSDALHPSPPNP